MSSTSTAKTAMAAIMALLIVSGAAAVMLGNESEAAISGDYGQVYEIDLAPGFSYTYTPTYPSDLDVTTTIHQYETAGLTASMNGSTLTVTVKDGVTSGSYDLILKAQTSTGGLQQTAYQHIRFNIVSGLTVDPGQVINDIIKGASVNFTPSASSDMGTVTWSVKSGTTLPAGLSLSNGKVTGTPTKVGQNTVQLTATAKGQTQDLTVSFTVYNVIVGGSDETIFSNGSTVSSTPISQTGSDLGVTWAVTSGTLPSGFTLNSSTGVISGSSTALGNTTVTITGTASNGPAQSTTKNITIKTEPKVAVSSGSSTITTYPGASAQTLQMTSTSGTSAVTWSVSSATGVSINSSTGVLTVTNAASSGTVTVTATTAYGATATKTITIVKESAATITGNSSLTAAAGSSATATYTSNLEGTWTVSGAPAGVTATISNGVLSISGSSPTEAFDITITLNSASGQTVTKTVTCQIVSQLIFDSEPANGLIALEI